MKSPEERLKEILKKIVRENIKEMSTTGTGATQAAGQGEQYASKYAFSPARQKLNRAVQMMLRQGWGQTKKNTDLHAKTFDVIKTWAK